jgi:tRNA(Ile2) C34 agmatinyltransferase TiaS
VNFLGPDDNCPRCHTTTGAEASDIDGRASYRCGNCGHAWTTSWNLRPDVEPRLPARARELMLEDPSRFAGEDTEGRYIYDDDPDW